MKINNMSTKIVSKCCGAEVGRSMDNPNIMYCKSCNLALLDTKQLPQEKTWETLEVGDEVADSKGRKRKILKIATAYELSFVDNNNPCFLSFVEALQDAGYTIIQPQETIEIFGKKYPKSVLELLEGREIE